jgi:CobQ-like glutamine amidotransferase family enzyme
MKTVRLAAFHHDRLNLNGDVLNLLVLAKRLNWRGIGCEVVELNGRNFNQHLATGIDFALLGHGSIAAWSAIDDDDPGLETAILSLIDKHVPLMGIATGYERLVKYGILHDNMARGPRVSEFTECEFGGQKLIGYVNSDSGLPPMSVNGNTYGTLLHGPVLAKNPAFADELLSKILSSNLCTLDNEQMMFADEMAMAATEVARGMLAS